VGLLRGLKQDASSKARPTKVLPTERIQFNKQLDILRAYAAASGQAANAVSIKEVAGIVHMVESTVSMCNAFFTDVGLVLRTPSGLLPAPDVLAYGVAFHWNQETAAHKLAPTLRGTWFSQKLVTRLGFQPLEESEAVQVLAEEAAASKVYQRQVTILVDYLAAAGIVARDNGLLRLGPNAKNGQTEAPKPAPAPAAGPAPTPAAIAPSPASVGGPTVGAVQFQVAVNVDMTEFRDWDADRISAFFGGIAQVLAAKRKIEGGE